MRLKFLRASVIGLAGIAVGIAVAQGWAPASTQAQAPTSTQAEASPTLEELRKAVASLRGGRIPRPTSYDALTREQKAYVNSILSGPRGDISGSLGIMMVSPGLGDLAQKAIAYARFAGREGYSTVPPKLSELAILMGARAWTAQYAWNAHERAGLNAGLSVEVVEAVKAGRRPTTMEKDVEAVYNFCNELLTTKQVSDATFEVAKRVLRGDQGVVDLVGTLGLYQMVAMLMVVDRMPLPPGVEPPLKPLK